MFGVGCNTNSYFINTQLYVISPSLFLRHTLTCSRSLYITMHVYLTLFLSLSLSLYLVLSVMLTPTQQNSVLALPVLDDSSLTTWYISIPMHMQMHQTMVTYHRQHGFVPTVKSHGYSKKGLPFHPTWSSTKKQIKEKCANRGPKSVVASLSAVVGGVLEASAPGQLLRDEKQVINYKSNVALDSQMSCLPGTSCDVAADDHFMIMQKAFTGDPFV